MLTREMCKSCGRENPLGFSVPTKTWQSAVPKDFLDKTLCIICFDLFATERSIEWTHDVKFWPVSGVMLREYNRRLTQAEEKLGHLPISQTHYYTIYETPSDLGLVEEADAYIRVAEGIVIATRLTKKDAK